MRAIICDRSHSVTEITGDLKEKVEVKAEKKKLSLGLILEKVKVKKKKAWAEQMKT